MSNTLNAVAIGEMLWDLFPDQQRLGGAPANFAIHLANLSKGAVHVSLATAVGKDDLGDEALRRLKETDVDTGLVSVNDKPTGQVHVTLDADRSPSYEIVKDVAWDDIRWSDSMNQAATRADVVCFGTLAQRSQPSRDTIQQFIAGTRDTCIRILDINLRPTMSDVSVYEQSLHLANVLKLSDEELPVLASHFDLHGSVDEQLQQLKSKFALNTIAYTCGGDGAVLIHQEQMGRSKGHPTTVVDTVGAGDSFTAAMAFGLIRNQSAETIVDHACRIAAYVCSQQGATPKIPDGLMA